jgi:hypothetical protein
MTPNHTPGTVEGVQGAELLTTVKNHGVVRASVGRLVSPWEDRDA